MPDLAALSLPWLLFLAILAAVFLLLVFRIVGGLVRLGFFLVLLGWWGQRRWSPSIGAGCGRRRRRRSCRPGSGRWRATTLHSPESRAAWLTAQRQLETLLQRAKTEGTGVLPSRPEMAETLDGRIAALRRNGHPEAAEELAELRRKLLTSPERP